MVSHNLVSQNSFEHIFLNNTPLIDVRSPKEFAQGAFYQATNLFLLTDEERALVGICYAKKGQDAAIKLGHELVTGDVKEKRMQAWVLFSKKNPQAMIYCARGGLRSQIVQEWLREAGIDLPRIEGGFKSLRGFLLTQMNVICPQLNLIVIGGYTGAGKTEYLKSQPHYIDLEALANHRGSAFGGFETAQPTTANFENELAVQLLKIQQRGTLEIAIEDESHLIGRLLIPQVLFTRMMNSPLRILPTDFEERVQNILAEYVIKPWQALSPERDQKIVLLKNQLQNCLNKIHKKLGGTLFKEISADLENAFDSMLLNQDFHPHAVWIKKLLLHYYDPMYEHYLSRQQHRQIL